MVIHTSLTLMASWACSRWSCPSRPHLGPMDSHGLIPDREALRASANSLCTPHFLFCTRLLPVFTLNIAPRPFPPSSTARCADEDSKTESKAVTCKARIHRVTNSQQGLGLILIHVSFPRCPHVPGFHSFHILHSAPSNSMGLRHCYALQLS